MTHDPHVLPPTLPVPRDDGRARHLVGARLPRIALASTGGSVPSLDVLSEAPTVFFFYPRTGVPGQPPNLGFSGEEWDDIPGARGCTPQSCAFRDRHSDFSGHGVSVFGVSTQTTSFQAAFKARNHVPFDYLSDSNLALTTALSLPTFEFPVESGGPNTLLCRMSWFVIGGHIEKVWYPVFPPNEDAARVLAWLDAQLPLFRGVERDGVVYRRERSLDAGALAALFAASGIGRPHEDAARLGAMLASSNLVITARVNDDLVGVARSLSDFAWCTYLSDLAVARAHQGRGIGRALVELTRQAAGPECGLVLVAAPSAETYYPQLGMERLEAAFRIRRER